MPNSTANIISRISNITPQHDNQTTLLSGGLLDEDRTSPTFRVFETRYGRTQWPFVNVTHGMECTSSNNPNPYSADEALNSIGLIEGPSGQLLPFIQEVRSGAVHGGPKSNGVTSVGMNCQGFVDVAAFSRESGLAAMCCVDNKNKLTVGALNLSDAASTYREGVGHFISVANAGSVTECHLAPAEHDTSMLVAFAEEDKDIKHFRLDWDKWNAQITASVAQPIQRMNQNIPDAVPYGIDIASWPSGNGTAYEIVWAETPSERIPFPCCASIHKIVLGADSVLGPEGLVDVEQPHEGAIEWLRVAVLGEDDNTTSFYAWKQKNRLEFNTTDAAYIFRPPQGDGLFARNVALNCESDICVLSWDSLHFSKCAREKPDYFTHYSRTTAWFNGTTGELMTGRVLVEPYAPNTQEGLGSVLDNNGRLKTVFQQADECGVRELVTSRCSLFSRQSVGSKTTIPLTTGVNATQMPNVTEPFTTPEPSCDFVCRDSNGGGGNGGGSLPDFSRGSGGTDRTGLIIGVVIGSVIFAGLAFAYCRYKEKQREAEMQHRAARQGEGYDLTSIKGDAQSPRSAPV